MKTEIMTQIENHGLLRPVYEVPLLLPNGQEVPNKKAILFEDNDSYISTVGSSYEVISNESAFSSIADSLIQSGLNLEGMTTTVSSSKTKSRNLVHFHLPAHRLEVLEGDEVDLQIVARNSYDGSWKMSTDVGGFRIACANGQVRGDYRQSYSNRHTSSYDGNVMVDRMIESVNAFAELGKQWLEMTGNKITRDQAIDSILVYLGKKLKDGQTRHELIEAPRQTLLRSTIDKMDSYIDELGLNEYAVYNTMTDDATHHQSSSQADSILYRQKQIPKALEILH